MRPSDKNQLPALLTQNPSPVGVVTQDRKKKIQGQVDRILTTFRQVLPSNYVSQVTGPYYTVQFQAIAEQIAEIQIEAQEAWSDRNFDFTRPSYLFQILGAMVFPDMDSDGVPDVEGDLSYRTFLKRMVVLLLQGATKQTVQEGVELLTDADVEVLEKALLARQTVGSAWSEDDDQFAFEINISKEDGNGNSVWPVSDPFKFAENLRIVLRALKPAHTLYTQRFLFREVFGPLFEDSVSWDLSNYYYEDFRRWCYGARKLKGAAGTTLSDRSLWSDPTRDFQHIVTGSELKILSGPNAGGHFRVLGTQGLLADTDVTPRAYTTAPTGLSGSATVSDGVVLDSAQDWSLAKEGEILTFTTGPNSGASYRMGAVLGTGGGPVGFASGPGTRLRVAHSILRLDRRMRYAGTNQAYEVSVDRLGTQEPHVVVDEDASLFFLR
jgi:hypothetical protein